MLRRTRRPTFAAVIPVEVATWLLRWASYPNRVQRLGESAPSAPATITGSAPPAERIALLREPIDLPIARDTTCNSPGRSVANDDGDERRGPERPSSPGGHAEARLPFLGGGSPAPDRRDGGSSSRRRSRTGRFA